MTIRERLEEKALCEDFTAQGVDSNGVIHTVIQLDGVFYMLSEGMDAVSHRVIESERVIPTIGMVHEMESA